jgi:AcrR family transcriptional regulator
MIKKSRWRRRKEARPGELSAAALELFVEKGYAATRLDEVAARVGVSKGTLYLYFESKEDLFKAVVKEGLLPALAEGERVVASFKGPSTDLLRVIALGWLELIGTKPIGGIPKLIIAEARNFPEIARFYYDEVIARGVALLKQILERGMDRGEFRTFDAEIMVHLIFAPLIMSVIWRHSLALCGVWNVPSAQFLDEYLQFTLRGLRRD